MIQSRTKKNSMANRRTKKEEEKPIAQTNKKKEVECVRLR
jgi:hypothetical protein